MSTITTTTNKRTAEERRFEQDRRDALGWTQPMFESTIPFDPGQSALIGEIGGRKWFRHSAWGEVAQAGTYGANAVLPNGPVEQATGPDGERVFRAYSIHAPGTYARLTAARPVVVPKPKPPKPVDALVGVGLLTKMSDDVSRYRIRGAAAILERLTAKGIDLGLSADGSAILPTSVGGRWVDSGLGVLAPLLTPYLRDGKAPACAVTNHPKPVEAVTIAVAWPTGIPWCGDCSRKVKP